MNNPLVSISCITYNHGEFLKECLEGFLMQQCQFKYEILIHDDASTDNTQHIIKEYQSKYPEIIKPIFQKENQYSKGIRGIMARFNFNRARGKYIALCEGDDYWTDPLKLQKQVDFLEGNPEYGMCFTRFKTFIQAENIFEEDKNGNYFLKEKDTVDFDFDVFQKGWHVGTQTLVFERDLIKNLNFSKYKYFRDVHLFAELLFIKQGACLKEFCAVYRLHSGGIHTSISSIKAAEIGKLCYEELSNKNSRIKPLREKFKSFYRQYIYQIIENKKYLLAFKEISLFSIEFKDKNFFITQQKRVIKAFLNS